jgi:GNAT superfamily N-acetyltransferase
VGGQDVAAVWEIPLQKPGVPKLAKVADPAKAGSVSWDGSGDFFMQTKRAADGLRIRPASRSDWPVIWEIFRSVIKKGDTYAFSPEIDEESAHRIWFATGAQVFVAEKEGQVAGTFFVKPNQPGLGSHVANAGFMVDPELHGVGIGRVMGEFALAWAQEQGYRAMQFNFVVSTNTGAVALWKKLGFAIIGTIPRGFRHAHLGYVDVYVMYREL